MRITRNQLRQLIQEELGRLNEQRGDCNTDTQRHLSSFGPRYETFNSREEAQQRVAHERETFQDHIAEPPHDSFGCRKLKFIECLEKLIRDEETVWPAQCQVDANWS